MNDIDSFKASIETFISERDWTPTRFGREIAGDPLFVFDLREGREPRSETRQRITRAMQAYASGEGEEMRPLRIGIAGLGTVGAALISILTEDGDAITRKLGRRIVVSAVSARSRSRDRGVDISPLSGSTTRWRWPVLAKSIFMSNSLAARTVPPSLRSPRRSKMAAGRDGQ